MRMRSQLELELKQLPRLCESRRTGVEGQEGRKLEVSCPAALTGSRAVGEVTFKLK